jgi:3-oxoacyl-[acyl-carrier-protein] synthase II
VVTAWGLVSALGADVSTTFDAMAEGRSGVSQVTRFDATGLFCDIGGQIQDDWLAPADEQSKIASSSWRVARPVLEQVLQGGGLSAFADRTRVGVVLGGHATTPQLDEIRMRSRHWLPNGRSDPVAAVEDPAYVGDYYSQRQPDVLAALLADAIDARGPVVPIVSACAAGTQAIGEAMHLLRAGRVDAVLAGGAEPLLCYMGYVGFSILGALTRRYPSPEKASRPFDRRRNGFVIAEGAGLLLLETLASARARGAEVFGEILGYGDSADAHLITAVHPEGRGAIEAMQAALADAGLTPTDVDYVNAHGTSTPLNDPTETHALKQLLGARAYDVPVSSNKSMLGHTIGAAGAIEAILTLEGMRRGVLLPTINQESPDRRCDLDYVPNEARELAHRVALSNSFGFGGQNGCLCLGAAPSN